MSYLKHAKQCLSNQSKFFHLNAFIALADSESILSGFPQAGDSTSNNAHSSKLIAIKDNICTHELPTTAASGMLKDFTSPYDATVVKQLRTAGAIMAGKTNMDEFGMGSHSKHSYYGPVLNESLEGDKISSGGSSGGSAVAVATGQCWAALGTDTGGSVRLPAAYTGTVGYKPSYGLLSRWGVIAYANSLDTVGILSSTVRDARELFTTLDQYDHQDPTSLPISTRSRLNTSPESKTLRIGIPIEYNISSLQPSVRAAWLRALRGLRMKGHTLHPVSLPATRHALSAYYILAPAEASSNLAKYDGVRYGSRAEGIDGTPSSVLFAKTRGQAFGAEVRRRILLGAFSLSADAIDNYFIQAQKIRRLVQRDFDNVFAALNPLITTSASRLDDGVDVLICPTAPTTAPLLKDLETQDPIDAYMNDVFTVPASLAGLPAISVPVPIEKDARTVGMQVIGQYGEDDLVLNVAEQLEAATKT